MKTSTVNLQACSRACVLLVSIAIPFAVFACLHISIGSVAIPEHLPSHREERRTFDEFAEAFGDDQFLLISWDGCSTNDPRLEAFRELLLDRDRTLHFVDSLETTEQAIGNLTRPEFGLNRSQAIARLQGLVMGKDRTEAMLLRLTSDAVQRADEVIPAVQEAAEQTPGLGQSRIKISGQIFEAFCMNESASACFRTLATPASLFGLLVAWICIRNFLYTSLVIIAAFIGSLFSAAMLACTRSQLSDSLIVMPIFIFLMTLSGATHLINYYRVAVREEKSSTAIEGATLGLFPCSISTLVCIIGLCSLIACQLESVQWFAAFSAIGLFVSVAILFVAFPQSMDWCVAINERFWPSPKRIQVAPSRRGAQRENQNVAAPVDSTSTTYRFVRLLDRFSWGICFIGFVLLAVTMAGLSRLQPIAEESELFSNKSRVQQNLAWIEAHVGPVSSIEILLTFDAESNADLLARATWVQRVSNRLRSIDDVRGVLSAATYLPTLPTLDTIGAGISRSSLRNLLDEQLGDLVEHRVVVDSAIGQTWRITAKISAMSKSNYGLLKKRLEAEAKKVIDIAPEDDLISLSITGLAPLVYDTQVTLLRDLGSSFATSCLMMVPFVMIIARGWWLGLLIMMPSVLPVAMVFGTMGWFGRSTDLTCSLTGCIAIGIAFDGAIHFTNTFVLALRKGAKPFDAVLNTFQACGDSIFHTILISCSVLFPFLVSDFAPARQFASCVIAMLSIAAVSNLVILPALLLCPLGRIFEND